MIPESGRPCPKPSMVTTLPAPGVSEGSHESPQLLNPLQVPAPQPVAPKDAPPVAKGAQQPTPPKQMQSMASALLGQLKASLF